MKLRNNERNLYRDRNLVPGGFLTKQWSDSIDEFEDMKIMGVWDWKVLTEARAPVKLGRKTKKFHKVAF